jgi:type II secretory pathway predicted ATPase ExeA
MSIYYNYFNLDNTTFSLVSHPKYVYKAASFRTSLSLLSKGFRNGNAMGIVTGKVGTGKTTLCQNVINEVSAHKLASVRVNPLHTTIEILEAICDGLNIEYPKDCDDEALIHNQLFEFLTDTGTQGKSTFIIVDEAQNIGNDLFQYLCSLSSVGNSEKIIHHVLLAGQPELIDYLKTMRFSQPLPEDIIHCELEAMDQHDTASYIKHRLIIGGATGTVFSIAAESAIYEHSQGIPRSINILCDHCLRISEQCSEKVVTDRTVNRAQAAISPYQQKSEANIFKQGIATLAGCAERITSGVSQNIEEIFRPLQQLLPDRHYAVESDNNSIIRKHSKGELIELAQSFNVPLSTAADNSLVVSRAARIEEDNDYSSDVASYEPDRLISDGMTRISHATLQSAYSKVEIVVDAFLLDTTPVTNKVYARFVEETSHLAPDYWLKKNPSKKLLDHPVVGINYSDACSFAEWCGKRLPTTSEWEAAARGPDNLKFPWGNNWESTRCNTIDSLWKKTTAVDSYPQGASREGCLDLVGNVWEWTDWRNNNTDLESGYAYVFGGSFRHQSTANDVIARSMLLQINDYAYVGFRCAKDLS